jgi:hypothetical protein
MDERRKKHSIFELLFLKKEIPLGWLIGVIFSGFTAYGALMWQLSSFYDKINENFSKVDKHSDILETLIKKTSDLETYNQFNHIRIKEIEGKVSVVEKRVDIHDKEIDFLRKHR